MWGVVGGLGGNYEGGGGGDGGCGGSCRRCFWVGGWYASLCNALKWRGGEPGGVNLGGGGKEERGRGRGRGG